MKNFIVNWVLYTFLSAALGMAAGIVDWYHAEPEIGWQVDHLGNSWELEDFEVPLDRGEYFTIESEDGEVNKYIIVRYEQKPCRQGILAIHCERFEAVANGAFLFGMNAAWLLPAIAFILWGLSSAFRSASA